MYWPHEAHRTGKSSSTGALFDPFVTNSTQTCQELTPSTLAGKSARNAALSTRSFPGAPRTPASRGIPPPPARERALGGSARPVHRPQRRPWRSESASQRGVKRLGVSTSSHRRRSKRDRRAWRCPLPLRSPAVRTGDGQRCLGLPWRGRRPGPSPCLRVRAPAWIPPPNWRQEMTAASGPVHVQTSRPGAAPRGETGKLGIEPHGSSHMESLATHLPLRAQVSPGP
ncbi:hypothetical protein HPG69_001928, partial [Diceros bicornis minor]